MGSSGLVLFLRYLPSNDHLLLLITAAGLRVFSRCANSCSLVNSSLHFGWCPKSVVNWIIKLILHRIRRDLTNPYVNKKDGLNFVIEAVF